FAVDPEAQYMLDVGIRQLRLGEGVRGYPTPEGACLVLGDMINVLDVPLKIDLAAKKASGWAFREDHKLEIDAAARTVRFGNRQEALAPSAVRETPEGWCVDSDALARWLGIGIKVSPYSSVVTLTSEARLPVELSQERDMRAKHLKKPAAFPLEGLPRVKLAYRMWRAPALDFIVSAGVTYNAASGARIDRRASIRAAGEIARLSYDATVTNSQRGLVPNIRFKAYRSEPDGGLLGPLDATHFAIGDVSGPTNRLIAGGSGRGAEVTNRPLFNPASFDRTRFDGDLPAGWDAELYRNGQLVAFAKSGGSQRYTFEDVELGYGDNRFEIVSYGPQGQQRSRVETINVGQEHVPPGKTHYYVGLNQPGSDLLGFVGHREKVDREVGEDRTAVPKLQAAAALEHGLDKRTSVAALAAMMIVGDEKLTFIEGSVRRSIGSALVEASVAKQLNGGMALRGSAIARLGSVNVAAEGVSAQDFFYQGRFEKRMRDARFTITAPLKLGQMPLQLQGDARYTDRLGQQSTKYGARVQGHVNRINFATGIEYERLRGIAGDASDRFDLTTLASGRIGEVRVRGGGRWEISPRARLRSADLTAYWSASDRADWEIGVGYEAQARRTRARLSHIRRFDALAAAASIEAASDGSVAVGINLNFSLDGSRRGFRPVRDPLASVGQVEARIFRDDNMNGRRDSGEPVEEGALLTASTALALNPSGKNGIASANGLTAFRPVAIGVDASSLSDPSLAPLHALQVIVPRPGVTARLDIPLVGAGDIEGALVNDDGSGFEGLDLELIDAQGRTVATARSDYDGFFLFERVAYGSYRFRLTAPSASAAKISPLIEVQATVSPASPVARLGAVRLRSVSRMAIASAK
ncbi:MAG: carboxypeptidase-like regulatory domain-containing protein, partial [Sphingomonas bacterium]|nr:carboxypeptidase-like regulatory domain-containing protein [Sphingomonas bacterium]